jgi:hypothetical protein
MSELTPCNFCSLIRIRKKAAQEHLKVTILRDANWGMGGVNVYKHPPEINIRELPGGERGPRAQYHVAWFMDLGDHCEC